MDDGINIRFYKVGRADKSHPMLLTQLEKIFTSGNQAKRTKDANGLKVRLERLNAEDRVAVGEFVRLQEVGYPSEVHDDKVLPLSTDRPLGHHVAFAYHKEKHVLAIEYDLKSLALSRINQYISQYPPYNSYFFTPLYRRDTWSIVESAGPKKMTFAIAHPHSLNSISGDHKSLYENISQVADATGTHIVEVTLSMGQTNGLLKDAYSFMKDLARRGGSGEFDLRKLKAKVEGQADEINLIDEMLNEKITLELPKNDPSKSYNMRVGALKAGLERNADKF